MNEGFHSSDGYLGALSVFLAFASIAAFVGSIAMLIWCAKLVDDAKRKELETRVVRRRKWR